MPPCPCLATSARWCSMFLPMPVAMTTTRHATCAGCCPSPFSACFLRRRFPRVGCCPSRIIRACRARPVDPRDQRRTGPPFLSMTHPICVCHWCVPALRTRAVVHCFNKPRLPNMCTVRAARAGASREGGAAPRPAAPAGRAWLRGSRGLAGGGGARRGRAARAGHKYFGESSLFLPPTPAKRPRTPRGRRVRGE